MKQLRQYILSLTFVAALTGCSSVEQRLPVGVYRDPSGPNFIAVSTNQIKIHIEGMDGRDENGTGRAFRYALWRDGRLFPIVQTSSEMYGYPALDYYWDGTKILASDSKSKRAWQFTP